MTKSSRLFARKERGLTITRLMARDGERCAICAGALDRSVEEASPDYITFDHIKPVSLGGEDALSNFRLAHARCNHDRGDAYDPEFDAI